MNEINEMDLERVSGGAGTGEFFSIVEWRRRNCDVCENQLENKCKESDRMREILTAQDQWNQGKEWNCPWKR